MQWLQRSDIWLSALLVVSILITSVFMIDSAYQTRQMYSELQELSGKRSTHDRVGQLMSNVVPYLPICASILWRASLSLGAVLMTWC